VITMALARNSLQNTSDKGLRGHNTSNKGVRSRIVLARSVPLSSPEQCSADGVVDDKVGCHRKGEPVIVSGSPRI
jgi:hypothetical protein